MAENCTSHMDVYIHVWETMALRAPLREVANKSHQGSRYADLAVEVHAITVAVVEVEVLVSGDDLVIEGDVSVVGDDNAGGWGDDDISQGVGYSHVKTTNYSVGAIPNHVPERYDSDQKNDLEYNFYGQNDYYMAREVGGCKESGDANMIYAYQGTGAAHHPKSSVSSEVNVHAVVGVAVNGEKEGIGDSSTDNQVRVFLAHLESCNVYCSWL